MSETTIIDGQMIRRESEAGEVRLSGETPSAATGQKITDARTPSGFPRSGPDISENDIVKLNGSEGRIKDMLRAGLLTKNADGSFSVADRSKATQAQQDATQETPEAPQQALASDLEATISEVATKAQVGDVLACIHSVASTGAFSEAAIARVGAQMGMSPEAARDQAETIRAGFEAQARASVDATGLDSEEVFAWAWEHAPDKLKAAMVKQATERTTTGYQDVVQGYTMALDTTAPEAILSAQFPDGVSAVKKDGRILLRTPHGETDWRTAVRKGWVKVGRARR